MISPGAGTLLGTVTEFVDARGLGEITASTPDATVYPFHCVSIADGSRTIQVGVAVSFVVLLKMGLREAADIRPA